MTTPARLSYKDLSEPGYYWWLPEYLSDNPQDPNNWQVVSWHPANTAHAKVGVFIGPLTAPTYETSK